MDEQTPLIQPDECPPKGTKLRPRWTRSIFGVENRILLAGFIITLSFSYTQVPYAADSPPTPGMIQAPRLTAW